MCVQYVDYTPVIRDDMAYLLLQFLIYYLLLSGTGNYGSNTTSTQAINCLHVNSAVLYACVDGAV